MAGSALSSLKRRLEKLESFHAPSVMPRYLIAMLVSPGEAQDLEPDRLTYQGRSYTRQTDEDLDAFLERIRTESGVGDACTLLLFSE